MLPTWTVATIFWLVPGMLTFKLLAYLTSGVEPYRSRVAYLRGYLGDRITDAMIVLAGLLLWPIALAFVLRDRVMGYYGRPDPEDDGADD